MYCHTFVANIQLMSVQIATLSDLVNFQNQTLERLDSLTLLIQQRKDPERLVGKCELADLLDCAESTIDGMRRKGIIKAYYVGIGETGHPKFRPSEVFLALKERSK